MTDQHKAEYLIAQLEHASSELAAIDHLQEEEIERLKDVWRSMVDLFAPFRYTRR